MNWTYHYTADGRLAGRWCSESLTWTSDYENQDRPRFPEPKISVEDDMVWQNPNRSVSWSSDTRAGRPRLISSDLEWVVIIRSFLLLNIYNKTHFVSISFLIRHISMLYLHGIRIVQIIQFLAVTLSHAIYLVTWLWNYAVCLKKTNSTMQCYGTEDKTWFLRRI